MLILVLGGHTKRVRVALPVPPPPRESLLSLSLLLLCPACRVRAVREIDLHWHGLIRRLGLVLCLPGFGRPCGLCRLMWLLCLRAWERTLVNAAFHCNVGRQWKLNTPQCFLGKYASTLAPFVAHCKRDDSTLCACACACAPLLRAPVGAAGLCTSSCSQG